MAAGRAIRAGAAYVELLAEDNKLVRGLERAQRMLTSFGAKVRNIGAVTAAAGAAMTAPFLAASKIFQDVGDDLAKMSARTGIAVESLSELNYAAGQSGSSAEELEKAIKKMAQVLIDGERGLSTSTDALDALGLSLEDLLAMDPERQFLAIAKSLAAIEDPTRRAAVAQMIFGRVGTRLLPLINDGIEGIDALRQAARDMGLTISTDSAKRAELLGDRLDDVRLVARAAAFAVGDALAPAMIEGAKRLITFVVGANKWVQANKEVVVTAAKVALATVAIGSAIVGVGLVIIGVGAVFGVLASAITTVLGLLAFLLKPISLVTIAFARMGGDLKYWANVGGSALEWLAERFSELAKFAKETIAAIGKAIQAGDLEVATEVAAATIELALAKGMVGVQSVWSDVLGEMLKRYHGFIASVKEASLLAFDAVKSNHRDLTTDVAKGFHNTFLEAGIAREHTRAAARKAAVEARFVGVPLDKAAERELAQIELDKLNAIRRLRNDNVTAHAAEDLANTEATEAATKELEDALIAVEDALDEKLDAIDAAGSDRVKAATEKLEAAEQKYRDAIARAEALELPEVPETLRRAIDDIVGGLGSVTGVKALGTFSASAAADLGFAVEEKQLEELKAIHKGTRDLLREFRRGGAFFT